MAANQHFGIPKLYGLSQSMGYTLYGLSQSRLYFACSVNGDRLALQMATITSSALITYRYYDQAQSWEMSELYTDRCITMTTVYL
jgi:hypothetical protein